MVAGESRQIQTCSAKLHFCLLGSRYSVQSISAQTPHHPSVKFTCPRHLLMSTNSQTLVPFRRQREEFAETPLNARGSSQCTSRIASLPWPCCTALRAVNHYTRCPFGMRMGLLTRHMDACTLVSSRFRSQRLCNSLVRCLCVCVCNLGFSCLPLRHFRTLCCCSSSASARSAVQGLNQLCEKNNNAGKEIRYCDSDDD